MATNQPAIRPAEPDEIRHWHDEWSARLDGWYDPFGAHMLADRRRAGWEAAQDRTVLVVGPDPAATPVPGAVPTPVPGAVPTRVPGAARDPESDAAADRQPAGIVAVALNDGHAPDGGTAAVIFDLYVVPEHRQRGYGRAAVRAARGWADGRASAFGLIHWGDDPGLAALVADLPVRSERRYKRVAGAAEHGEAAAGSDLSLPPGVTYRPMARADFDAWLPREIEAYAVDMIDSGSVAPDLAREQSAKEYETILPQGMDTPGYTWWAVDADGEQVADIWISHAIAPGLSYVFSVEVVPGRRGRGYGRAAMAVGEAATRAAGDAFLGLNVFGHNLAAINLYGSMGYRLVDSARFAPLRTASTTGT